MIGQTAQTTLSVARTWADEKDHRAKLADAINNMLKGKLNNVGDITLTAATALTTLTDARIGANSYIDFMPQTANAAAEKSSGNLYISSRGKGTADITHTSTATNDRTFTYAVLG